jgi:hypothetical protein
MKLVDAPEEIPTEQLEEENMQLMRELEKMGVHVNPVSFLKIKLDLMEVFLVSTPIRQQMDRLFESAVNQILLEERTEVTRKKLTEGIHLQVPPGGIA